MHHHASGCHHWQCSRYLSKIKNSIIISLCLELIWVYHLWATFWHQNLQGLWGWGSDHLTTWLSHMFPSWIINVHMSFIRRIFMFFPLLAFHFGTLPCMDTHIGLMSFLPGHQQTATSAKLEDTRTFQRLCALQKDGQSCPNLSFSEFFNFMIFLSLLIALVGVLVALQPDL